MDDILIEGIEEADLPDIAALHAICFEDVWRADLLKRILSTPRAFGLFHRAEGEVAGFVLFRGASDEGEILSLAVTPSRRRNGLGLDLMQAALQCAAELDIATVFLEVAEDNLPARELYDRMGFAPVGRRAAYYRRTTGPSVDALTLKLNVK